MAYYNTEIVQQGWQCPLCKRILSPWTIECPCKGNIDWNNTNINSSEVHSINLSDNIVSDKVNNTLEIKYGKHEK